MPLFASGRKSATRMLYADRGINPGAHVKLSPLVRVTGRLQISLRFSNPTIVIHAMNMFITSGDAAPQFIV